MLVSGPPVEVVIAMSLQNAHTAVRFTLILLLLSPAAGAAAQEAMKTGEQFEDTGIQQYRDSLYADALNSFKAALSVYAAERNQKGQATAQSGIAMCLLNLGEKQRALEYLSKAVPMWRQAGDIENEGSTLGKEGDIYRLWGFPELAIPRYKQALPLFLIAGDRASRAAVLNNLGLSYLDTGDRKRALQHFQSALALFSSLDDIGGQATAMINIAGIQNRQRNRSAALAMLQRALEMAKGSGNKGLEAASLNAMGQVYATTGDRGKAMDSYNSALLEYRKLGDRTGNDEVLKNIGMLTTSNRR